MPKAVAFQGQCYKNNIVYAYLFVAFVVHIISGITND